MTSWGAVREQRDKSRWHTSRGPLSVTGTKFFNWHDRHGAGGAIDLVMHLGGCDAGQAIEWLWHRYGNSQLAGKNPATASDSTSSGQLRLPVSSPANLERVRRYLHQRRHLSAEILASLIDDGKLYADGRGNAVFLMVAGKPNRPIGAELRGTGNRVWRGLAPGTRRDSGYFWIGRPDSQRIVLCESAIDAISCYQLQAQQVTGLGEECICISTAGVRSDAPWLRPLLARGYAIYCGFDTDEAGEAASRRMIARQPSTQRLRPPRHDWNETLTAGQ
ncbi:MAG: DUF3991 domain-containing protein [Rhodobacteraceae bacterium]|nr:DUF3991 domain-containing protein [Paracoccaceae bacterium]